MNYVKSGIRKVHATATLLINYRQEITAIDETSTVSLTLIYLLVT
jgi:hypothetical protein